MATPLRSTASFRAPECRNGRWLASEYKEFAIDDPEVSRAAACTWTGAAGWARQIRLFPDGCVDLVWTGDAVLVHGPSDTAVRRQLSAGQVNTGIRIHAGAGGALLGTPLWRLKDRAVLLKDVLVPEARIIEPRLRAAQSDKDRRTVLQELVLMRTRFLSDRNSDCRRAVRHLDCKTVRRVASELKLGERDMRRLFADEVGLSPKALQRVLRFRKVLRILPGLVQRRQSAAAVAADTGYADQAHMSRECRRLAGATFISLAKRFDG